MNSTILEKKSHLDAFFCRLLLFSTILVLPEISKAQCIATTTRNPTSATNDNGVGTIAFSSTTNIFSSNNAYAEADAIATLFTGNSNYLKATGFGFTVPDYGIICGVVVTIERKDGGFLSLGTGVRDNQVRLVVGNTVVGNNLGTSSNWDNNDETITYGSSTEMWGNTLTPAIVNASNFGIAISAHYNSLVSLVPSAQVDNIRMTIHYNPILPTHILSFTSILKNNIVKLSWTTADEEDGEIVTLQRTATGQSNWMDIARFDMHTGNNIKNYTFSDLLADNGNYSYRLRITNLNGMHIYSEIKSVRYTKENILTVYPNPATDHIIIENIDDPRAVTIGNYTTRVLKLPIEFIGNNTARADIRLLPAGVYFANTGQRQLRFIKH